MIRAILFDADGVVINRDKYFSQELVKDYGVSKEKIEKFFQTEFQECLTGRADLKEVIAPYLKDWGVNKSVDGLLDDWFSFENRPNLPLIQKIKEIKAQGIKCYLATNQEKYRAYYLAERMGFLKLFDHLFISSEVHRLKPEPDFFDYVWESIQYLDFIDSKEEVLLVDDTQKVIDGADAYGFKTYLYDSQEGLERVLKGYKLI